MGSFQQVFGGNNLYPADVSLLELALTANVTLEWPVEASTGVYVVARIIDITPTGAYSVTMPDASQAGVGQVVLFNNLGPSTVTIEDNVGGTICSLAAGEQWEVYLYDNTTAAGLWRSFRFGAATAQAQASLLAGYGLVALGSTLNQSQAATSFNSDYALGAPDRASFYLWDGGVGTLTTPSASAVGNNWFVSVRNGGTGNLTLATPGAELINGASTLVLRPGDSATVNTDGTDFYTVGFGQQAVFAFDYTSIDLTGQSSPYVLSGSELNRVAYKFVGTLTTDTSVTMPNTTQQYWVDNETTGGSYLLEIGVSGQSPYLTVPRNSRGIYYSQGSAIVKADTASIATPIAVVDGGTGATTAGGALINLGGTAVGTAVFTAADAATARMAIGAGTGSGSVTSIDVSGGTTGLTFTGGPVTASGTITLGGDLGGAYGGTGQTGYAIGDILYASGATALSKLADVATGNVLLSGGVTTAPAWGKVGLTTHVTGTLPVANGGTGITSFGTGVATALGQNVTGSGGIVLATSPTLVTPVLGAATATTVAIGGASLSGNVLAVSGAVGVTGALGVTGAFTLTGGMAATGAVSTGVEFDLFVISNTTGARINANRFRVGPAIVQNGDEVFSLFGYAYDGVSTQLMAAVQAAVDGTPGAGNMPSRLSFLTTPSGTTTITERMRIDNTGLVTAFVALKVTPTTVASLPTGATVGVGARVFVTDANSSTFHATAVGGGSNNVPVYWDGSAWKIG